MSRRSRTTRFDAGSRWSAGQDVKSLQWGGRWVWGRGQGNCDRIHSYISHLRMLFKDSNLSDSFNLTSVLCPPARAVAQAGSLVSLGSDLRPAARDQANLRTTVGRDTPRTCGAAGVACKKNGRSPSLETGRCAEKLGLTRFTFSGSSRSCEARRDTPAASSAGRTFPPGISRPRTAAPRRCACPRAGSRASRTRFAPAPW